MKNKIRIFDCIGCGIKVEKSCTKNVNFCSPNCYQKNKKRLNLLPKKGAEIICEVCKEKKYKPLSQIKNINFCSANCHNIYQSKKIEIICDTCKEKKYVSPSFKNQKYCSIICRDNSIETKNHLIQMNLKQNKNKAPNRNELLGYECLNKIKVKYESQYLLFNKFCVDAYLIDFKTVIQFDGDYWHGNKLKYKEFDKRQKKRMALDISQDAYLKKMGIHIIRIWESDLKSNPEEFIQRIKNHISQTKLF